MLILGAAMIALFLAGVSLGILTGRISSVGGIQNIGLLRSVLGALAVVSAFTLIVGGFVWLSWYWPLLGILIGSIIAAAVVTRTTWASLFAVQPIIDAATIAAAGYWLLSG
jgi:hypothetical protein